MADETRAEIPAPEPVPEPAPTKRVIFGRGDGIVVIEPGAEPVVVAPEAGLE